VKARENVLSDFDARSSSRPFNFSEIVELQKHMVCAIDFSASILMLKTISFFVSLGKCYSVWAGLTCITSQTLPLEFADRKCPCSCPRAIGLVSSVRSFRKAGYCFDHSSTENTQMC